MASITNRLTTPWRFFIILSLTTLVLFYLLLINPSNLIRLLWSSKESEDSVIEQLLLQHSGESGRSLDSDAENDHETPVNTTKSPSSLSNKENAKTRAPRETSQVSNASCSMPQPPSYRIQKPQDDDLHELLLDYMKFHKKARACLVDPNCQPKPKILVATCVKDMTCLGLGDRMRGLVFSFTIALITKRVYFLHELSDPYPLQLGFTPNAFDWTLPPTVNFNHSWPYLEWYWCMKGSACTRGSPEITELSNFNGEGPDINMVTDDFVKMFDDKPVVQLASRITFWNINILQENPHLRDTYAGLSKFLIKRRNIVHRLLFQPSEVTKQMMKAVEFKSDYMGVHIRTGMDSHEQDHRFRYISSHEKEVVNRLIECMGRVGGRNITNVFLASDSSRAKKIFTKQATAKGYTVHVLRKRTVHYGRLWSLGTITWDALCEGFIAVFSDLFMLSNGKIMLNTGSNFADLASNLAQGQRVIQFTSASNFVEQNCATSVEGSR